MMITLADLKSEIFQLSIREICKKMQGEGFVRHGLQLPEEQSDLIDKRLLPGLIESGFFVILAYENDNYPREALGIAICQPSFSTYWMISTVILQDLYVIPERRKEGFAKAILACLELEAVTRKCCRIELTTTANNIAAGRLYQSLGYSGCDMVADGSLQKMLEDQGRDPSHYAVLIKKSGR